MALGPSAFAGAGPRGLGLRRAGRRRRAQRPGGAAGGGLRLGRRARGRASEPDKTPKRAAHGRRLIEQILKKSIREKEVVARIDEGVAGVMEIVVGSIPSCPLLASLWQS